MRKLNLVLIVVVCVLLWLLLVRQPKQPSESPQEPYSTSYPPMEAGPKKNELYFSDRIAALNNWKASVYTPVKTECDILTPTYAVEVEWTTKPYEAVGQCLHYGVELNKKPAMLFLLKPDNPTKSYVLDRVGKVADKYGIEIWWVDTEADKLTIVKEKRK